jgi:hypothetical protein
MSGFFCMGRIMPQVGFKMSEESKAKMRAAKLGVKRKPFTDETKQKMRERMLGTSPSEATRQKLRKHNLGRIDGPCPESRKRAISLAKTGKARTPEHNDIMRKIKQAITFSHFTADITHDQCWNWHGKRTVKKNRGSKVGPSRQMYERFCGSIEDGLFVCHSCDNPQCIRPSHLWLGTPKENIRDMVNKGRNVFSKERRKKMSEARKGRVMPEETKHKISVALSSKVKK